MPSRVAETTPAEPAEPAAPQGDSTVAPTPAADVSDRVQQFVRSVNCAGNTLARYLPDGWDRSMFAVLGRLVEVGPQRLSELAEGVHLDLSTVSRLVARLVQEALVERQPDPADGRASRLVATDSGRRLLDAKVAERREVTAQMLADWSPEELAEFAEYLRRFTAAQQAFLPRYIAELKNRADPDNSHP